MKFQDHVSHHMKEYPLADRAIVEEVNRRIDQFAHFPNWDTLQGHRKFLHHQEGIEYFGLRYGEDGRLAARLHILDDIGHIPNMIDYHNGTVDGLGNLV